MPLVRRANRHRARLPEPDYPCEPCVAEALQPEAEQEETIYAEATA